MWVSQVLRRPPYRACVVYSSVGASPAVCDRQADGCGYAACDNFASHGFLYERRMRRGQRDIEKARMALAGGY
jgi:hypothetical protein